MLFQNVYILLTLNTFDVVNNYFNNITLETWFVCWAQSKNDNLSLLQNSRFFFLFCFFAYFTNLHIANQLPVSYPEVTVIFTAMLNSAPLVHLHAGKILVGSVPYLYPHLQNCVDQLGPFIMLFLPERKMGHSNLYLPNIKRRKS